MNSKKILPIEPRQSRSKKKFEEILDSAEQIIFQGKFNLTFINLSSYSKFKRASIYKYFPSIESLYIGILSRHLKKFSELLGNNFKGKKNLDLSLCLNIYIDLFAIYSLKNIHIAEVISMCDVISINKSSLNKTSFVEILLSCLDQQEIKYSQEKLKLSTLLATTILLNRLAENKSINPRTIAEAKKATLAYLNTP